MAIQTFTAAQVLTAAQMNSLQANDYNQTVSAKVASYTLVAADKGTRITMSNAAATTVTVNTSLFAAGDSLRIQNIGAGTCTITAGTATVTSAGSLIIPQWGGGQLFFTSASAAVYFPDAVTATPGGLTLIKTQVVGTTVASVNVTSAFSSTYDNYKIVYSGGLSSTGNSISMQLGSTTTGYYNSLIYNTYSISTPNGAATANGSSFDLMGRGETGASLLSCELINPNAALNTFTYFIRAAATTSAGQSGSGSGYLNNTTQYTDFTIAQVGGTLTGGTIYVYGYAKA